MNVTLRIPLRVSQRKKGKIEEFIDRQEELARFFSDRIYSFPIQEWGGRPNKSMRDLPKNERFGPRGKNGMTYSCYKNSLFEHINDTYANMRDGFIEEPDFSEMGYAVLCSCGSRSEGTINRSDSCELQFDLENSGVQIPLLDEEDEKDWFSMRLGEYQRQLFEQAESIGSSPRIVEVGGRYELHQPLILPEEDTDYEPESFVGVDFNFDRLAFACFLDSEGNVETVQTNDHGRRLREYRERHRRKRKQLQEKGLSKRVEESRNKVDRMTENTLHTIAKNIVDQAGEMEKPVIKLEDTGIQEMRDELNKLEKSNWKSSVNRWAVGKLIEFIEYKAEKEGICVEKVDPRNTSKECHKCGETGRRPNQRDFFCRNESCENFDSRIDADMNAALNIARA
jgi:IS605 OrfB family transposase